MCGSAGTLLWGPCPLRAMDRWPPSILVSPTGCVLRFPGGHGGRLAVVVTAALQSRGREGGQPAGIVVWSR